ncbi:MAG: DUF4386 domain-containing protein [Deltaproteobacteria bacterium]|nr:DUF4386 domain-containing protein [Deltaproteobacteria bacterium]NND26973.1 DUF4386 domain-containing protein [Myxococcales bacterium]MBT8467078.1 DUF4386 domain-containing protein [Deltaproteobacteria bacterium]MBT8481819.1 DUF4386 domain-containing protein [Deltaproteobacteria bacterium]NNK08247.1 DUF4386 domain-containing protein [Myxococcales bacterium]
MTSRAPDTSPMFYARVAGIAYLVITFAGVAYGALVESRLVVSGNHAETANNIIAHESLFRIGIVAVLIIYLSVVVASWALYLILRTVREDLALLALLLRLAEAIVGAATVLISLAALSLLSGQGSSSALEPEQLQSLAGRFIDVRTAGLDVVLVFIGLGATISCYLLFESRYVPRPLAAWGIFTYVSLLFLALVSILFPRHPLVLQSVLYSVGGTFELVFGLWLVFKGINLQQWEKYA